MLKNLNRVLVRSRVSDKHAVAFAPKDYIFADTVVVFGYDKYKEFAVLQSNIHETWARKYASSLRTDMRYVPTGCFETFPFPQNPTPEQRAALEQIGEQYHEHRRHLMLTRQEGLTATYNRFHDPSCQDTDIAELRRLHVELDQAVLAAYGWSDVTLDHAFRGAGKEARFSLSEGVKEELLRRLLLLNFEIAAGEEAKTRQGSKRAGKQGGKKSEAKRRGKEEPAGGRRSAVSGRQESLPGLEDDRPRQLGLFEEEE
jgi:hypothetical protein